MLRANVLSSYLFILVVLSLILKYGNCSRVLSYGVTLTTIPPRFGILHHQLRSWLNQSIEASKIRICIPKAYKRFRSKRTKRGSGLYRDQLMSQLKEHTDIAIALQSRLIEVVDIEQDWGPLSKFIGSILSIQSNTAATDSQVDYWILSDDDMVYSPNLAEHYAMYINAFQTHNVPILPNDKGIFYDSVGFTMFTSEQRLQFHLNHLDGRIEIRNIPHIQGVDSYIVPAAAFSSISLQNLSTGMLIPESVDSIIEEERIPPLGNASNVLRIISRIHNEWCPESFYQDDYIVSTLLSLSGLYMHSARLASPYCSISYTGDSVYEELCIDGDNECKVDCINGLSLTNSIEGVSKHHYQMHMKDEVFMRETITQQCLMTHADEIYNMLLNRT